MRILINHIICILNLSVGDSYCFLFSVKPNMGVYHPTGYNENFMYLNMGMQTMPNGLVSSAELFTFTWPITVVILSHHWLIT